MKPTALQFDDEEISISLTPEEFDHRVRELLSPAEAAHVSPICSRIIYWRGEIPKADSPGTAILWWFAAIVAIGVLVYGFYSLIRDFLLT